MAGSRRATGNPSRSVARPDTPHRPVGGAPSDTPSSGRSLIVEFGAPQTIGSLLTGVAVGFVVDDDPARAVADESLAVVMEVVMVRFAEQGEVIDVREASAVNINDMVNFALLVPAVAARVHALAVADDHGEALHRRCEPP